MKKTSKVIEAAIKARPGVVANYSWDKFDQFWEVLLDGHTYDNHGQHLWYEPKAADIAKIIRNAQVCNCQACKNSRSKTI